MVSSTLRVCICKNALAHRRASNVPISAGGTKEDRPLISQIIWEFFLKGGKRITGVRGRLWTDMPFVYMWCLTPLCQSHSKGQAAGRLQRTEHTLANPRGDRRRTTGEPPSQHPQLAQAFLTGLGPAPGLALEDCHQAVREEPGILLHHCPFPNKPALQIFLSLSWVAKPNQGELNYLVFSAWVSNLHHCLATASGQADTPLGRCETKDAALCKRWVFCSWWKLTVVLVQIIWKLEHIC